MRRVIQQLTRPEFVTSEDWNPVNGVEDIDPSVPVLFYVREGNVGRFVATYKKGLNGQVSSAELPIVWSLKRSWNMHGLEIMKIVSGKKRGHKQTMMINTSCYYYNGSGEESAFYVGSFATPAALPEPFGEEEEDAEESLHIDASDPVSSLTSAAFPHGLTHTVAVSDCIDCIIATRRIASSQWTTHVSPKDTALWQSVVAGGRVA